MQFEVTSHLGALATICDQVRSFCVASSDLRPDDIDRLEIAVNEAAANIMMHAYEGGEQGRIVVETEATEKGIVVRLLDWGQKFVPAEIPTPTLDGSVDHGFGLFLIAECVEEFSYSRGKDANCICLTKRATQNEEKCG